MDENNSKFINFIKMILIIIGVIVLGYLTFDFKAFLFFLFGF